MKKLYSLSLAFLAIVSYSFAQSSIETNKVTGQAFSKTTPTPLAIDTMVPPAWNMACGDSVYIYGFSSPASGSIFGNNSYGETEAAQRYNFVTGSITEVLVWYGKKKGAAGTTTAKIYSINSTTKAPQTALGTSAVVTTGSITTNPYTSYMFSSAVSVSGGFYAAVTFPTTSGDSVGILSFKFGCASNDSLSWINIPSLGGWRSVLALFGGVVATDNADIVILPIGNINSGVSEYSAAGLSLLGAYPNPAKDETSIRYSLADNSKVTFKIFDLNGNTIKESTNDMSSGEHVIKLNVNELAAGNYYYTITSNTASLTSKFSVIK